MGCLESIVPRHDDALVDWWLRCRLLLHANARPTFDTAILLTAWCVWKERNNRTFNRSLAGLHAMFLAVIREAEDWAAAGFASLNAVLPAWSQNSSVM